MRTLIIVVLLLIGVIAAVAVCALLSSACENEVVQSAWAPRHLWKAVVFQRDCGATTGFTSQISIIGFWQSVPHGDGTVFVADTDHGRSKAASWGGPPVEVRWLTWRTLEVRYDPASRVFLQNSLVMPVRITFVPEHQR